METDCVFNAVVAMDVDKINHGIELAIQRGIISLSQTTKNFHQKEIELTRQCRLAVLLKESGVNTNSILFKKIAKNCIELQRDDGGWSDVPETMWCVTFLNSLNIYSVSVKSALNWLDNQSRKTQGWGNSIRDSARIPVTGLILYLLPQLASDSHFRWLETEWGKEWRCDPCLNYKAAFALMAFWKNNYRPEDNDIIIKTISWLSDQQNIDGGWGPWKNHPLGSDPWCTGICLTALIHYLENIPQKILANALRWLKEKQLPNGLWPYHYIEVGSIWALYAMVKGFTIFSRNNYD